jgi:peptidoglycan/LPS O-acetylase OafA/YrhL
MNKTTMTELSRSHIRPLAGSHFHFLDLLKAFAAQLIVLHHLAFYGPMTDHARRCSTGWSRMRGSLCRSFW